MENLEVGDLVLCTVDRIVGTIVFVSIEGHGEGSIIFSEIAPGRIRNIRDYVVPKKQIVCKVLRISGDRIDLSLRRVTQKEKKEVLEIHRQEKSCRSVLKGVLGNKAEGLIKQIDGKESVYSFCERIKDNPKELEKLISKESAKKITDILKTQKKKITLIKKDFILKSNASNGLTIIKDILLASKEVNINYLSAGLYSIEIESENPKTADTSIRIVLENIEKEAKRKGLIFSIKEK